MCARKPAQLHHKQPSNLSPTFSLQNHHLVTGVVQLIPGSISLVTRLETLRKYRRQLSPVPRVNLRDLWCPKPSHKSSMDNEINENLSNEMSEMKGCHQPLVTSTPSYTPAQASPHCKSRSHDTQHS